MVDDQNSQLWFFCAAAGHELRPCESWPEHRGRLRERYDMIESQLAYLDDIRKVGKVSQEASRSGQVSLSGKEFPQPVVTDPVLDSGGPIKVYWLSLGDGSWATDDKLIVAQKKRTQPDKPGARAASIECYKPYIVEIYFDGEPDEWNEYR